MSHDATASTRAPVAPLRFYGGTLGALAPVCCFVGGVAALALQGAPDEKGFWPVLLGALVLGLLLARDRHRYAEAMLDGMSQRVVMVMVCAWLFAGLLGAVLNAAGVVAALAWVTQALHLSGGAYVAVVFLVCVVISTATGTSFGTILLCGPLLYPAGAAAHADPAVLMGAILGGATFGDSISPVSDTTIASSGSQHVDIAGTVRQRLQYVIPAGFAALLFSLAFGGADSATTPPTVTATVDASVQRRALLLFASPALVIAMLLRKRHLIEALLVGIATAVVFALVLGVLQPTALLRIDAERFGATGVLVDGMQRSVGVIVFTLLLVALVGTIQATDLLDRLVRFASGKAKTARAGETWIVGVVSAAVLLTTHSVVAILAVGEFARQTGARVGVSGYRRANLLDLTVCTWPFLLPYFLPTILAASASQSGAAMGMPSLSPAVIGLYNSYAWGLVVMLLVAVGAGFGRGDRPRQA